MQDTTIVSHEAAPISAFYEQRCLREMRVDDLFADVRRALNDSTAYIRNIQYDAAYGFPRSYWITRGFDLPWGTVVESFATSP